MNLLNENNLLEHFGYNVRNLRKKRKLTQMELAVKANVHRNCISMIEVGKQNPTLMLIYKISRGLNYKMTDLIKEID